MPPLLVWYAQGFRGANSTVKHDASQTVPVARVLLLGLLWAGGCQSPFVADDGEQLRRDVIARARAAIDHEAEPGAVGNDIDLRQLGIDPQRIGELDRVSGPGRHRDSAVNPGEGLDGTEPQHVRMTLQQAIMTALRHNLSTEVARIAPQIRDTQITEARGQFDPVAFSEANVGQTDRPQAASALGGVPVEADAIVRDTASVQAGVRSRLYTGGELAISSRVDWIDDKSPGTAFLPDPASTASVGLELTQPLLRDFGEEVNTAQIVLANNAKRRDVLGLEQRLLQLVAETEAAYWELVFARHRLAIQQDLLDETRKTRDELDKRRDVDVNPVQLAQAEREVRANEIALVQARVGLRDASDQLKRLLDSPDLPLMTETLVEPSDFPEELPNGWKLYDAVAVSIQRRPELGQVLIDLEDVGVQRKVADNQRLPRLDLTGQVRTFGLDQTVGESYGDIDDDVIDYLVGLRFERPLNNRAADAVYQRTRLTALAQRVNYRDTARGVILSVKQSMRAMTSAYEVVGIARAARRAAAENLRALREREQMGESLTPEFLLDLKLRTQQRLADAELQEMRALVNYNIARVRFYQAIGTLLDERGIAFEDAARPGRSGLMQQERAAAIDGPADAGERVEP